VPTAVSTERVSANRRRPGICGALVAAQFVLLVYLLQLSPGAVAGLALVVGVPLAFGCYVLARGAYRGDLQLSVLMFAAGGCGLLAGCMADFGSLGVYGLLGMCRSSSLAGAWPTPEHLWAKMNLMPWAWLGMALGSNAAMALGLLHRRAASACGAAALYGVCNVGMLLGMVAAELLVTRLTLGLSQTVAGVAMIAAMLAGMVLGTNALLALARAARFLSASPAR
jgi:hypothetical protein